MDYNQEHKAVDLKNINAFKRLKELSNKKSLKVYDDDEFALDMFNQEGIPGSFLDF